MPVGILYLPLLQFLDDTGVAIPGAKLYSYLAGTSTPSALFAEETGVTPLPNPAIADAGGKLLAYGLQGQAYKLNVTNAQDVQQSGWPIDHLVLAPAPSAGESIHSTAQVVNFVGTPGASTLVAAGALPGDHTTLFVQVTVTQPFGTSQGAVTLACGDQSVMDRFGGNLTLATGIKPLASGGMPFYHTATDLVLSIQGGVYDGTGTAQAHIWAVGPS
jgi:hypothetical protein